MRAWPEFAWYARCFGMARGLAALGMVRCWPGSRGRIVDVPVPGPARRLQVRLDTSDINVFVHVFRWGEYAWDFAEPPRVIVDAGAYTGLSTAYFAMRYPAAKIIAIEPDEANFRLLLRNTSAFANVQPVRAALWVESGSVALADPGYGPWGLRLTGPSGAGTQVPAITMDDVLRDYDLGTIDLLKVDIEGSEKELFAAADSWIGRVDAICLELHDRFKPGCSQAFYRAVADFGTEVRLGEDVLVLREESRLCPVGGTPAG
ncbi:MAG TPA: FkbM family methyltransferase [Streptosporangiaceae bacterium]|nr:FkbM family methyltransferase [Streptosporangiaceae bacterium]